MDEQARELYRQLTFTIDREKDVELIEHALHQARNAALEEAANVAKSFPWDRGGPYGEPLFRGRREGERAASEKITEDILALKATASSASSPGPQNVPYSRSSSDPAHA